MTVGGGALYPRHGHPPTWEQYRAAVRRVDRDSLLINAAVASSLIARGLGPAEWRTHGLTPSSIADVARTALAWGGFERLKADMRTLALLGNMNVQIADEVNDPEDASSERDGRMLTRIIFEQFPGQREVMGEVARTVLLFGSGASFPEGFRAKTMGPDWFTRIMKGLSLEQYVESVLMIAVIAEQCDGMFSLDWLGEPPLSELGEVPGFDRHRSNTKLRASAVPWPAPPQASPAARLSMCPIVRADASRRPEPGGGSGGHVVQVHPGIRTGRQWSVLEICGRAPTQ